MKAKPEGIFTVTLDGPAGVGKSTIAKDVAEALGIAYLDTGAMFRATAWKLGEGGWNLPEDQLIIRLEEMSFNLSGSGRDSVLSLNGEPLTDVIRTEAVGMWASNIAIVPVVRAFQKKAQQAIAASVSLMAEGRDMGTVVFPDARFKFFLDATPEERGRRRCLQLRDMGKEADEKEIIEQICQRDHQDRNRAVAPLRAADDADNIDTTCLSIRQVFQHIMDVVEAGG
jgi:CMP/dCMP kinase